MFEDVGEGQRYTCIQNMINLDGPLLLLCGRHLVLVCVLCVSMILQAMPVGTFKFLVGPLKSDRLYARDQTKIIYLFSFLILCVSMILQAMPVETFKFLVGPLKGLENKFLTANLI